MIREFIQWLNPVEKIDQPFDFTERAEVKELKTEAPNVRTVSWGVSGREEKVIFSDSEEGAQASWSLRENKDAVKRLAAVELDDYDLAVIAQYRMDKNGYILLKPYVLAGWTYPETAKVINYSVSWQQRRGPKIKEAQRRRLAAEK